MIHKYLKDALLSISLNPGDDIYFVLGYLNKSTARSYVSKLKRKGMAYTHVSNGETEVWPTTKGLKAIRDYPPSSHAFQP